MASNNDMTMSRFLFAILQQKNLKDIDWNLVANNAILTQGITNGHAARMRYSRFKQSLMGHETKPRNRATNKSKVTKSKKETKPKKEKEDDIAIKPEPSLAPEAPPQNPSSESHQIKNENPVKTEPETPHTDPRLTPVDVRIHFQNRLLTPCSDTEMFLHTHQGFATSPVGEYHHDQPFTYPGAVAHGTAHDQNTWQSSPSPYSPSPFLMFDVESHDGSPFSGQHTHPQNFGISPREMMPDLHHTPVKHEEWDNPFHS